MKIKSILISQPKPETEKNPYFDLARDHHLKIDFRTFIHIDGIPIQDFRKERIHFLDFSAVILTSRNAVDHFFRIAAEAKIGIPDSMKYFCINEATAVYLQKYIVYRKRKIFYGSGDFAEVAELMEKHKDLKFILPSSDVLKPSIPQLLEERKFNYTRAIIYKTVISDLSDLAEVNYDMLVFFSPEGIRSLFKNFPDFKQNDTKIAIYGLTTAKAAEEHNLRIDLMAPTPDAPSLTMTMAIDKYVKAANKK